jgi:hypothetical protein
MRKQRNQPAFAGLNQNEIDQIDRWLHCYTYDAVRDRIARPRPEGFGLVVTKGPLQRLFAKSSARMLENHLYAQGLKRFPSYIIDRLSNV